MAFSSFCICLKGPAQLYGHRLPGQVVHQLVHLDEEGVAVQPAGVADEGLCGLAQQQADAFVGEVQLVLVAQFRQPGLLQGVLVAGDEQFLADAGQDAVVDVPQRAAQVGVAAVAVVGEVHAHLVEQGAVGNVRDAPAQPPDEGHVGVLVLEGGGLGEQFGGLDVAVVPLLDELVHGLAELEPVQAVVACGRHGLHLAPLDDGVEHVGAELELFPGEEAFAAVLHGDEAALRQRVEGRHEAHDVERRAVEVVGQVVEAGVVAGALAVEDGHQRHGFFPRAKLQGAAQGVERGGKRSVVLQFAAVQFRGSGSDVLHE